MNTYTPPQKNISHRIYTIHVGHLFWFQNGEFRRKVRDFHACILLVMLAFISDITMNKTMQSYLCKIFEYSYLIGGHNLLVSDFVWSSIQVYARLHLS